MKCIVTAGPTYEPLDEVRRLTNFSSGRLGNQLANYLADHGWEVTLLCGHYATWRGEQKAARVIPFTTTADLRERLRAVAAEAVDAVYHAAAVSDFGFGKVCERIQSGELQEVRAAKLSSRQGALWAELVPTPKIIRELRPWYPKAKLVGWKYELDGRQDEAVAKAQAQILECRTEACVVNGRAYGAGFGLVSAEGRLQHFDQAEALFEALAKIGCSVRPAL